MKLLSKRKSRLAIAEVGGERRRHRGTVTMPRALHMPLGKALMYVAHRASVRIRLLQHDLHANNDCKSQPMVHRNRWSGGSLGGR